MTKKKLILLKNYLDFLWVMTNKETQVRYKRAIFGFLWIFANPLLQMIIIYVVFSYFIKIDHYLLFLFTGLLFWQFFNLSLSKATPSFVYERSLIQKANFSKEVIPISIILSNFIHLLISLTLLFSYLIFTKQARLTQFVLIIPAAVWLLSLTIGFSLLTASLNVKYRDISFFVQSLLVLLFYSTPILYSVSIIPQSLHPLYSLNPLSSIFELTHQSVSGQSFIQQPMLIANSLITFIIIFSGIITFKKLHPYFADWL